MKIRGNLTDVVPIVRFTAILWLCYVIALAVINITLGPPPPHQADAGTILMYNVLYYIINAAIALVCIGLSYWTWIQRRLKHFFIPLIITITTVLPIIINWLMIGPFPLGPRFAPDNPTLRVIPFLFMGLLLAAWQYRWQYLLLIILGTTGLSLGLIWSTSQQGGSPGFQGTISTTLIQMVIFFAVGFSVSYLMSRLRRQQESLEAANIRLTHYASTLDQLSASRERNRLARELHDTLAHTLSGLSVQMETIKAYWEVEPQTARSLFDKSLSAAHTGLEETRRALKALRASPLDDLGLALAITTIARDVASRANLKLDLSVTDKLPVLSPDVEQCIYRVAQEAIVNVDNHARAKTMTVKLEVLDSKLTLTVSDDGFGFDTTKNDGEGHFGVKGMKERAELVGGELSLSSKPGYGTTVQLAIDREKYQ